jgi:hypothetical protein
LHEEKYKKEAISSRSCHEMPKRIAGELGYCENQQVDTALSMKIQKETAPFIYLLTTDMVIYIIMPVTLNFKKVKI